MSTYSSQHSHFCYNHLLRLLTFQSSTLTVMEDSWSYSNSVELFFKFVRYFAITNNPQDIFSFHPSSLNPMYDISIYFGKNTHLQSPQVSNDNQIFESYQVMCSMHHVKVSFYQSKLTLRQKRGSLF